jgi:hypothetical protein
MSSTKRLSEDPKSIFLSALIYERAIYVLAKEADAKKDIQLLLPAAVLSALALELLLKTVKTLQCGNYLATHNLTHLFNDLDAADKAIITRYATECYNKDPLPAGYLGLKQVFDIDEILAMSANGFTSLRYSFESNAARKGNGYVAKHVNQAIRLWMVERKPEWIAEAVANCKVRTIPNVPHKANVTDGLVGDRSPAITIPGQSGIKITVEPLN